MYDVSGLVHSKKQQHSLFVIGVKRISYRSSSKMSQAAVVLFESMCASFIVSVIEEGGRKGPYASYSQHITF